MELGVIDRVATSVADAVREADVVVVGFGAGGAAAAITAHDAGDGQRDRLVGDDQHVGRQRPHGAVQRQLAENAELREAVGAHQLLGGEDSDGGGQIEGRPFLLDVGGGKIDRDPA